MYEFHPGLDRTVYDLRLLTVTAKQFSVGLILGALFFGLGYLAGCGLLDSFTEKMARNFHFEYGTARAWGSFGYAIGAFFAGIFLVSVPISTSGWSRYLALYL